MFLFFFRPTLVLEVVLSCRLILNLRSAAGEISTSKPKPGTFPWSDNSKTRTYTNPSSSNIVGDQSRSTDLQATSMLGKEMKLEPNRGRPESTWNAQTLYTNWFLIFFLEWNNTHLRLSFNLLCNLYTNWIYPFIMKQHPPPTFVQSIIQLVFQGKINFVCPIFVKLLSKHHKVHKKKTFCAFAKSLASSVLRHILLIDSQ